MEASGAGLAGQGDAGQNGGQGAEAEGQQQGPDLGALTDQLGQYQQGQEQIFQTLQQMQGYMAQQQDPGQQEQQEAQLPDLSFLDDPSLTPEQLSQQLNGLIESGVESRVQQALQQHIGPLNERVSDMQLTHEAQQLTDEFPELMKPEVASDVIEKSRQFASLLGNPDLASKPALWRLIYMSAKGYDAHHAEGAETPDAAHLEGAGGAGPGGQQPDLVAQILNPSADDGLGRNALPF